MTLNHIGETIKKLSEGHLGQKVNNSRLPALIITLTKGVKYDNTTSSSISPPVNGYFEFCNKSELPCAIKVLVSGCDYLWEAPRPSYIMLPPNDACYAEIDNQLPYIDMIVLINYPIESETMDDSHSLKVSKFRDFIVYRINCKEKNVLLKFKGDIVEPRAGGSIAVKNLITKLVGGSTSPKPSASSSSFIDFKTNVKTIETVFKTSLF